MGDLVSAAPPDITIDRSGLWAQANAADDLEAWAPRAAEEVWRSTGQPYTRLDVERLAAKLQLLAEAAFGTGCFGALFFCPEPGRGPLAVVRLNGMSYPAGTTTEAILDEVLLPSENQLFPPEVEEAPRAGRHRIRVRQRAYTDDTRTVSDYVTYVFPFDEAAWLLSVAFADPRDADRWLAELDALADGVAVAGADAP
jgi:hypothetical protein